MLMLLQETADAVLTEIAATGGDHLNAADLASTLLYGLLGMALFCLSYKVFDWLTPFSLNKELLEEHNVAVGIVCGSFMIGVAIVVAAAIG